MSKLENGLNKKFGRLLVKEIIREKGRPAKYRCICDCGKEVITQYNNLYIGKTFRERMKKYGITFEEAINYKKFSKMPIVNKYKKQYTNRKKIEEERQKMIEYVNKM